MTICGCKAVLIVTREVADTSTNVAHQRIELRCDQALGHVGEHKDSSQPETWTGPPNRVATLLRQEEAENSRDT
jgi:hypothetical protein